jgi:hypothetical protein
LDYYTDISKLIKYYVKTENGYGWQRLHISTFLNHKLMSPHIWNNCVDR